MVRKLTRAEKIAQLTPLKTSAAAYGVDKASQQTQQERTDSSLTAPSTRMQSGLTGTTLKGGLEQAVTAQASSVAKGGFIPTTAQKTLKTTTTANEKARSEIVSGVKATEAATTTARSFEDIYNEVKQKKGLTSATKDGAGAHRQAEVEANEIRKQEMADANAANLSASEAAATSTAAAQQEALRTSADTITSRTRELASGGSGQTGVLGEIGKSLNLSENQEIEQDSSGRYRVKNIEEKDFEADPIVRAETRLLEDKTTGLQDLENSYKPLIDSIKATADNGKLSPQAKKQLAVVLRAKKKKTEAFNLSVDRSIEDLLVQEEARQGSIETAIRESQTTADVIANDEDASFNERVAQAELDRLNELVGTGSTEREAIQQVKQERSLSSGDATLRQGMITFNDGVMSGKIKSEDAFNHALKMDGVGTTADAVKVMQSANIPDAVIKKQVASYQKEVLGYDEDTIAQSKFSGSINEFFTGENTDVYSLAQFTKDAGLAGLSDNFISGQLSAISGSLSADDDIKNEAAALLEEMETKDVGAEYTVTKDKFGNIVRVNKATGTIERIGGTSPEEQISVDDPISVLAMDVIEGNFSISEVENLQGKEKAILVGNEVAKIRGIQQKSGQTLSGEELRKVSKELNNSDQFKALTKALPTLDSLLAFEAEFDKTGTELIGDQLNPLYRSALLEMKELFNLGVLTGPDLELMESIIPNPAGLWAQGPYRDEAIQKGITVMRDKIKQSVKDRLAEVENLYGEYGDESLPALKNARETAGKTIQRLGGVDEDKYTPIFFVELDKNNVDIKDGKFFSPDGNELNADVLFKQFNQQPVKKNDEPVNEVGLSRPERNKNPGNIKIGGIGDDYALKDENNNPVVDDQNHLVFGTPQDGFNAMKADVTAKISGDPKKTRHAQKLGKNPTIATLNSVYATDPNWKNNVASYLNVDVNTPTSDINIDDLIRAIINAEGGNNLLAQL